MQTTLCYRSFSCRQLVCHGISMIELIADKKIREIHKQKMMSVFVSEKKKQMRRRNLNCLVGRSLAGSDCMVAKPVFSFYNPQNYTKVEFLNE